MRRWWSMTPSMLTLCQPSSPCLFGVIRRFTYTEKALGVLNSMPGHKTATNTGVATADWETPPLPNITVVATALSAVRAALLELTYISLV